MWERLIDRLMDQLLHFGVAWIFGIGFGAAALVIAAGVWEMMR